MALQAAWYIALVWLILSSIHAFLSTFHVTSLAYTSFLNRNGLSVSPGHFRIYWSGCGTWVHRLATIPGLRTWFNAGSVVSAILLIASLPVLAVLLLQTFQQPPEQAILKPVIPGVNVPWSQMVYVALTIFVCAVLHELGHAVAAVKEQVRVDGYGVFVFLIYPGAFVDLHEEHMAVISTLRRLRIYSAGVWHNFVLAALGGALVVCMPTLMSPLFATGQGAVVVNVKQESALYGALPVGTQITQISGCPIESVPHFASCIRRIYSMDIGYCLRLDHVQKQQRLQNHPIGSESTQPPHDCCGPSQSDVCFAYESSQMHQGSVCLNARNVTANRICRSARHCISHNDDINQLPMVLGSLPFVCAKPQLDPTSRLLRIQHSLGEDVMFEGNPYLVFYQVHATNYSPRWRWASSLRYLPVFLEFCGVYLMSISSALCFLNVVPVYYLDGHWVLITLIEHFLPAYVPSQRARNKFAHAVLTIGTILLSANVLVALVGVLR
eukprot:scpid53438/ scgid18369/ Membrane-bound transcription factor site-2 protease; Endopeptidase S2P